MDRVFVTRRIPDFGLEMMAPHCELEVWPELLPPSPEILREKVKDCVGLVSLLTDKIDAQLMDAAPMLRIISNFAVGVNNIDLPAATQRGIPVGNTPGVLTEATADIAVTLLLAATRRLGESLIDAKEGRWLTWDPRGWLGQDLSGRTLGIVGMGRIGLATAKRLHAARGIGFCLCSLRPQPRNKGAIWEVAIPQNEIDCGVCKYFAWSGCRSSCPCGSPSQGYHLCCRFGCDRSRTPPPNTRTLLVV